VAAGAIALCCSAGVAGQSGLVISDEERTPLLCLAACFLLFVAVVLLQMSPLAPYTASAWYYAKAAELLGQAHEAVPSLAVDASRDALLKCLACAGIFLVARALFHDRQWARLLLMTFVLSGALEVSYAIYAEATTRSCYVGNYLKKEGTFLVWQDHCLMSGTFVGSNSFGCFVGMALVAVIALLFDGRRSPRLALRPAEDEFDHEGGGLAEWLSGGKLVWLAFALYLLGGALFSASRAGVAATVAGVGAIGYLLARGSSRRRVGRVAIIGVVVGVIILGVAGGAFFKKMSGLFNLANLNRVVIWDRSLAMVAESPWLGWGLGTYSDVYAIHQPASIPQPNDKAHSTPLEFAVELGGPGAVAAIASALLPWGVGLMGALRRRRRRYLAAAAFAVPGVAMLHSTVDFSLQIPAIAFAVSALLGMGWAQTFATSEPELPQASFAPEP